tara:strand:- start:473 stop:982 length:510 start_codon:yes stop_codon:yes gene_type:complete
MAQGISISSQCVEFIKEQLPDGGTILELGSGQGTVWLADLGYTMYSVENQLEWCDKFPNHTTYINCKLKYYDDNYTAPPMVEQRAWFDPDDLFPNLPDSYDLILIDGPGGPFGRGGFLKHIDKFNTDVLMIFDDINRAAESILMDMVSEYVDREYQLIDKYTGVIHGKS